MNWLVNAKGECEQLSNSLNFPETPYRLYRFLTDVEDILGEIQGDRAIIQAITPLVRRLLTSSTWIQLSGLEPDPDLGWAVQTLYDEPDFPLTVQLVSWLPHQVSSIHNHGAWGIVAIIDGVEKNQFWRRAGDRNPNKIEFVGDRILSAGEIIGFTSEAIHSIEALEPTISFNLYGETKYDRRFEFNVEDSSAQLF